MFTLDHILIPFLATLKEEKRIVWQSVGFFFPKQPCVLSFLSNALNDRIMEKFR